MTPASRSRLCTAGRGCMGLIHSQHPNPRAPDLSVRPTCSFNQAPGSARRKVRVDKLAGLSMSVRSQEPSMIGLSALTVSMVSAS